MAALDPSVFRSYDIRGTYPDQLDEEFAYRFGRALAVEFATPRVAVGHDARLSSPVLYGALCAGLEHAGARVDAMGMCATELVYYAAGSMPELDLAVMITASHNPPEYNGFKVVKSGAEPVPAAAGLDGVRRVMEAMDVPLAPEAPAPPSGTRRQGRSRRVARCGGCRERRGGHPVGASGGTARTGAGAHELPAGRPLSGARARPVQAAEPRAARAPRAAGEGGYRVLLRRGRRPPRGSARRRARAAARWRAAWPRRSAARRSTTCAPTGWSP